MNFMYSASLLRRFSTHCHPQPSGCILWTGYTTERGYGVLYQNRKKIKAHRVAYFMRFGTMPSDMTIHHKCMNKLCVNPDHLELLSNSLHVSLHAHDANFLTRKLKTVCKHGHPLVPENVYVAPSGARNCRECQKKRANKWWSTQDAAQWHREYRQRKKKGLTRHYSASKNL